MCSIPPTRAVRVPPPPPLIWPCDGVLDVTHDAPRFCLYVCKTSRYSTCVPGSADRERCQPLRVHRQRLPGAAGAPGPARRGACQRHVLLAHAAMVRFCLEAFLFGGEDKKSALCVEPSPRARVTSYKVRSRLERLDI